jgi:hypothetical protein
MTKRKGFMITQCKCYCKGMGKFPLFLLLSAGPGTPEQEPLPDEPEHTPDEPKPVVPEEPEPEPDKPELIPAAQ